MPSEEQFILSIGGIISYKTDFYTFYWQFLERLYVSQAGYELDIVC